MRTSKAYLALGAAVLVTAVITAAVVMTADMTPESDFLAYFEAADSIAHGGPYTYHGIETAYWSPGYPLLLAAVFALTGTGTAVIGVVNVVLHVTVVALTYALALLVLNSRTRALVASVVVGILPDMVYLATKAAAENLAAPVLIGALCLLILWLRDPSQRTVRALSLGCLLGVAILVRPAAQFIPALMAGVMVIVDRTKRVLKPVLVMTLGCFLVLTPWIVRNAAVLGSPIVTTNGGANLRMAYNPNPTGLYNPDALRPTVPVRVPSDEVLADASYRSRALRFIATQPGVALEAMARNARMLFWAPIPAPNTESLAALVKFRVAQISAVLRLLLAIAAIAALVQGVRQGNHSVLIVAAVCVTWIVAHILVAPGSPRYMASILPMMVVLALSLVGIDTRANPAPTASADSARVLSG